MNLHLNSPQRQAIEYLDGPCLILAGAGSGKTLVITHKIAWLIEQCEIAPARIAAITFTNKAAREMQERVGSLLRQRNPKGLTICTFHALGVRIIREESVHCGLKPQFSILDASDALQIVSEIARDGDKGIAKQIQWQISTWKNALISPEQAQLSADNELRSVAATLYPEYQRTLRAYQAVDFDDLIALPVWLFDNNDAVVQRWQNRLRYILIDEYQDTNRAQYRLLRHLIGLRGAFTAVGDDDQAIYAWRGADSANLRLLQQDYPTLQVIKLEQNYRSTARILTAANTLIGHNDKLFEKRLWSQHGPGEQVYVTACRNPEHEALWVTTRLAAHRFEHRSRYADYAILYRGNHQARLIEQQLRNQGIPYLISGGQSFFDKSEIRDLLAYLRLLLNPDDDLAFIRAITVPRRGIGAVSLETLGQFAGKHHISLFAATNDTACIKQLTPHPLALLQAFMDFITRLAQRAKEASAASVLDELLTTIRYKSWLFDHLESKDAENRWRNVCDLVDWIGRKAAEDGRNLLALTQSMTLFSMLDKEQANGDAVQLATLHAAKGLEFKHVFLIGIEEGLLPHQSSIDDNKIEEERRLMYVGITRAQHSLYLSSCEQRKSGRDPHSCQPSRFIAEMGDDIYIHDSKSNAPVSTREGRDRVAKLMAMLELRDTSLKSGQ